MFSQLRFAFNSFNFNFQLHIMKAIHNILTVSKYESKTLFRSWFFRIFSILALLFVFLFNLGTQTSIGWPNGDMVALPSMIPFINLYIINIAQAIIAVFLASDFLKRDKKLDTTEVIYMRSMTNADYVISKTTLVFSIVFLSIGFGLGFKYISSIDANDSHRTQMLELNNKYAATPKVNVKKCDLVIGHQGEGITGEADMVLTNLTNEPLSEIILTLNPGLEVTAVNGAKFSREVQIIKLTPDSPLPIGGDLNVKISYNGTIDETFCYLDMTRERLELWLNRGNGIADKKHAFITPDYLLLTPETRWYPTAGISYSTTGLKWQTTQFSDFHLKVKTTNGLKAISQGKITDEGNGSFDFVPENKLPQMSLAIGRYITRSIDVDSVKYNLTFLEGHNTFDPFFKILPDSITPVIRDLRKTWETKVRFTYPYKRLNLIEIPVQFCSFTHVWSGAGEQVQPETVYLPEGGFKLASTNFAEAKKQAARWGSHDNQTISPRETEENYLKRFVNETLLSSCLLYTSDAADE